MDVLQCRGSYRLPVAGAIAAASQYRSTTLRSPAPLTPARPFSQTTSLYKKKNRGKQQEEAVEEEEGEEDEEEEEEVFDSRKGGKKKSKVSRKEKGRSNGAASTEGSADPSVPQPDMENLFDMTELSQAYDKADAHFLDELKMMRRGGRFSADAIGAIPVQPDKKSLKTYPLRELASVQPATARRWIILAYEEDSIKPIMSAIQKSEDFNQQPQRSEENPLELSLLVEPERADALVKRVKDTCSNWRNKLRDESHKRETLHKKWLSKGMILRDDHRKLRDKMQKTQDDRMKVIAAKEKEALAYIASKFQS